MNQKIGGFLAKRVVTEEEKVENKKRLEEWIESWKKLELKYPDIAKRMIC